MQNEHGSDKLRLRPGYRAASAGPLASWLDGAVGRLSSACAKAEASLSAAFFTPFAQQLSSIREDATILVQEFSAARNEPGDPHAGQKFDLQSVAEIFRGEEQRAKLQELDDTRQVDVSEEERGANRQLAVGVATVAVNVFASLLDPGLYVIGIAGLIYQARYHFTQGYRRLVRERRVNIHVAESVLVCCAALTGALAPLTASVFIMSVLRWIMAKTESLAHQRVSSVFGRQPRSVWMQVGANEIQVAFEKIQIGDIIIIEAGEMIPVDGVVTKGLGSVDQRMLTGEGQPLDRGPGDVVQASSFVLQGRLYIEVVHSGDQTVAAQIARMLTDTSSYKQELHTRAVRQLDSLTLPFMALSALAIPVQGLSSAYAILWAIPGFRMMFFGPLTMLSFMHVASRSGILLKSGWSLEQLRKVDTVVFDKTGTLTLEQPKVGQILCLAELPEEQVLALAAAAESGQTHPLAHAIKRLAEQRAIPLPTVAERAVSVGLGVMVTIDGHSIQVGSERLMALSGIALSPAARQRQAAVHAKGHSLVFVARGSQLVGALEICPTLRPEAAGLIAELLRRGKQVLILSGDHEAPTRHLATQLGVDRYYSQLLPGDKAELVKALKSQGKVVCFVGDGINDSVALQCANVSVSLKGATSLATTVAQIVLMSGNLDQMITLFDMAERFEHSMRVNRLAANIPSWIILGGSMLFGWSFLTAVLLNQITTPVALYSVFGPLAQHTTLPEISA